MIKIRAKFPQKCGECKVMRERGIRGGVFGGGEIGRKRGEFRDFAGTANERIPVFGIDRRQGANQVADISSDSEIAPAADVDDGVERHRRKRSSLRLRALHSRAAETSARFQA